MESYSQYGECDNGIEIDQNKKNLLLSKRHLNKWTFSWCLILLISAIVIGKLYVDHVHPLIVKSENSPSLSEKLHSYTLQDAFILSNEFIRILRNSINKYQRVFKSFSSSIDKHQWLIKAFSTNVDKYQWFFKAFSSGFAVTALTWFIIYKDSNIPGVNPPSPFSPGKKRISDIDDSKVPLNYLIGLVNGILVFIYMSF